MFAHRRFASIMLLVAVVIIALSPQVASAKISPPENPSPIRTIPEVMLRIEQQAQEQGSVHVIVRLNVNYQPEEILAGVQEITAQRDAIQRSQDAVIRRLGALSGSQVKRFRYIPYLAFSATEADLALLKTMPEVTAIEEDIPIPPALAESVTLVGATPPQTGGHTGMGQTVAILDSGVDKTHPFLAGKIVSEACYSTTDPGYAATTVCPDGSEESTAVGSGVNCSVNDSCNHGTHVAGIAAGKGDSFSGVASEASIIAIQVFSRFDSTSSCRTSPCILSFSSDQILALEQVYALRNTYAIAAVNMSLGGTPYPYTCDSSNTAIKIAIDNLRAAGIATVIASGNNGDSRGISAPACISTAISVGSTRDGSSEATPVDTVSSFSNSASFLSLLAPGQNIYSSVPGGQYATYQGTSMAAPHVAGAWAVMKSKYPDATVDQVLITLSHNGVGVLDTRNGITKPRIQVDAALTHLDDVPPTINGFSPSRGPAGTLVDIYGTNFGKVTSVVFNTMPAYSFTILSSTHIQTTVPAKVTSGLIKVISPDGTASSPTNFEIGANPVPYLLIERVIAPTRDGRLAWADYDNDGKLDVLVTGNGTGGRVARLYHNDGDGIFRLIDSGLAGASNGDVVWGDIDNDNDLDLLLTSAGTLGHDIRLYRNHKGMFSELSTGFPAVTEGSADLGDYDNDGDLDLAFSGAINAKEEARIYRNDGTGIFSNINASLIGSQDGVVDWVDYDNDGDQDLFTSGLRGSVDTVKLYRNENGSFIDAKPTTPSDHIVSTDWGDFDNDGDLDLLAGEKWGATLVTAVYRNFGGGTFGSVIRYTGCGGGAAWGDYNNDGDLDILQACSYTTMPMATIYSNDLGKFNPTFVPLHGVLNGWISWGDYDGDQDLDILLTGDTLDGQKTFLYRNDAFTANTAPTAPDGLSYTDDREVTLRWNPSSDTKTPSAGLTYNLRVGRTPGGSEVVSPEADPSTGVRLHPEMGNAGPRTNTIINGLPRGTYYWAVQAIDASYAASPFSQEQSFTVSPKVSFVNATDRFNESVGAARLEVVLDGPISSPVTVEYSVEGETATMGEDFLPSSGTLTFAPELTSQSISVHISDDTTQEVEEAFLVRLANPTGGLVIQRPIQEQISIIDNDGFIDSGIVLPVSSWQSSSTWGDYDNDGDLDAVYSFYGPYGYTSRIYRNDGGSFIDINAGLPGVQESYFEWIDYDRDGDLDLAYSGPANSSMGSTFTRIYRNTAGVFTDAKVGLPGIDYEFTAWADYDNDGDTDLLLLNKVETALYQNNAGYFTKQVANFPRLRYGPAAWGDYDNDGDLDLVLTGEIADTYFSYMAEIYRNDGNGVFTGINAGLAGVGAGTTAWGDYDNDGYLDLLVNGYQYEASSSITSLYHNNGNGTFTIVNSGLPPSGFSTTNSSWGDFDNDGDLDLLLAFITTAGTENGETRVYRNDGAGKFFDIQAGITGFNWTPNSWGDYDNDADLDLFLPGLNQQAPHIYQNQTVHKNTPPTAPSNLRATVSATNVTLRWDKAQDGQTPAVSLSYNLRVGTRPGGEDVVSPLSNKTTGYRSVPLMGNANLRTFAILKNLTPGTTYYWSVQAVDGAYAGSLFAPESSFTVPLPTARFDSSKTIGEDQPSVSLEVQLSYPSPQNVTIQYATSDDNAAAGTDYQAATGQVSFNQGETTKTITIPIIEDVLDEGDETFHISLLNPVNAELGASSSTDIVIEDNDDPPDIFLGADTANASENEKQVIITAVLSSASGQTVTVNYSTTPVTARAGSDYTATNGKITFAPGTTSQTISIPLLDDSLDEPLETFLLELSAPTNASIGTPSRSTITITDNDPAVQVDFKNASYTVSEDQSQVDVTVQLNEPSGWAVQAHYSVTNGTATGGITPAGSDFLLAQGDLSFSPGEMSKTFSITIFDDALLEEDETVNLTLSGLVHAVLGSVNSALLVIQDNESMPLVGFSPGDFNAEEGDETVTITVTLSHPSTVPVEVRYSTTDLTAKAGIDYVATDGTLIFSPGTTGQSLMVPLIDDHMDGDDKTANVALSNPVNATLPSGSWTAMINILDDDPLPTVQFAQSANQVHEGTGLVPLTVILSSASERTVTVRYRVTGGNASSDLDYSGGEGVLTFTPGQTIAPVSITILEDNELEPSEVILFVLFDSTNADLGQVQEFELLIMDNDRLTFPIYLPIVTR